jgi:hypothetical protein
MAEFFLSAWVQDGTLELSGCFGISSGKLGIVTP